MYQTQSSREFFSRQFNLGLSLALSLVFSLILSLLTETVQAQTYPSKPVILVVPQAAAGTNDIVARLIAPALGEALNGSVVVENRPGAGGNIGTQAVTGIGSNHAIDCGIAEYFNSNPPSAPSPLFTR